MSTRPPELWLLGVDFTTAPLGVREPLSYTPESAHDLLTSAAGLEGLREAVVVSTCNRTEFYLAVEPGSDAANGWLQHVRRARPQAPIGHADCLRFRARDTDAVRHLCRVACGLESLILGDVHIGGQLKQALAAAGAAGCVGPYLNQAFQHAFRALSASRRDTDIGRGHASLGSAVAGLIAGRSADASILVLGSGVAARDIGRQLAKWGLGRLTFINRSPERAEALAREVGGRAAPWDALDAELHAADVLVAATASPEVLLRRERLARCVARRPDRPLLIVDVGVPRNTDPPDTVDSVMIDDIAARRDEALARRQQAVPAVDAIIELELARWEHWLWTRPAEALLKRAYLDEADERAELVETLLTAGNTVDGVVLDRLISQAWTRVLHRHARGLRQWLAATAVDGRSLSESDAALEGRTS